MDNYTIEQHRHYCQTMNQCRPSAEIMDSVIKACARLGTISELVKAIKDITAPEQNQG